MRYNKNNDIEILKLNKTYLDDKKNKVIALKNISLKVKKGSKVKSGETLVILEAMKMEHSIKASEDGVISDIFIKENDQVENGAVLMVVDS